MTNLKDLLDKLNKVDIDLMLTQADIAANLNHRACYSLGHAKCIVEQIITIIEDSDGQTD